MSVLINQIKSLLEFELYSNAVKLCNLTISSTEQKLESMSVIDKCNLFVYYGDALYNIHNYIQAENYYKQALQIKKHITKVNKSATNNNELISDIDIKYKIHLCCVLLKKRSEATEMLQSISAKSRTPKINMALGNLFMSCGVERSAIACYKEVLKECPLALEAINNLLKLGVKGVEVNSLVVDSIPNLNWFNTWLKAQAQLHTHDYEAAIETYKSMDVFGYLKDNTELLVNMGYCYHYMCEDDIAIICLKRALSMDVNLIFGRDLLSTLLAVSSDKDHLKDLENLSMNDLEPHLWHEEHWIVLGNFMYASKKYDKAVYYGHQAIIHSKNLEALLLKSRSLIELNKYQEAIGNCLEALQICSFRYDIHQCIVDAYLRMNRIREAEAIAINACQQLNNIPHSLILHATVLLKDSSSTSKSVKKLLEKAIDLDKSFSTNALQMLAELHIHDQQYEQAKQLLIKYIDDKPTSHLHQLLGDCFVNLQKEKDAFNHYNIALRFDPNNQRAIEGLNNIGRSLSLSKRDSYFTCVSETSELTNNDNEGYAESDSYMWPNNSSFDT